MMITKLANKCEQKNINFNTAKNILSVLLVMVADITTTRIRQNVPLVMELESVWKIKISIPE